MNEIFECAVGRLTINDEGIIVRNISSNYHVFFPYGSIKKMKLGLLDLTIASNKYTVSYVPVGNQKKQLKELMPTLQKLNEKAVKCDAITMEALMNENTKIEKNVESISAFFSDLGYQKEGVENIVTSMSDDEEILYGFRGTVIDINSGSEQVAGYIGLISNRRFYYVGRDGKAINFYLKTGIIELKDVHAISLGAATLAFPDYIQFELNNDNYKLGTGEDTKKIKEKLEEGIKACESKANKTTIVQGAISAADELKKFKELLDMGIITQEEFDVKKKQLLGL